MSSALATGGGGTAARAAASARNASRALCGVMTAGSRSGSSGMICSITGSRGAGISLALLVLVAGSIGAAKDTGNCVTERAKGQTLMVRSASTRVSNHAALIVSLILRDARKRGLLR